MWIHLNWELQLIATVCSGSCDFSVCWHSLYMLLPVILLRRLKSHPMGHSAPLHIIGSFCCLSLRSLLTFCWTFVRTQFDDVTFLVLFLLWLGSITQRDRLLCLGRSLSWIPADILIGLPSQFQWNVLIFDIDILLLPHPLTILILCFKFALLENRRMSHIRNWKCSCQKIILLTIQHTHSMIFSSSIFGVDFSSELIKASSARLSDFEYISKLAWFKSNSDIPRCSRFCQCAEPDLLTYASHISRSYPEHLSSISFVFYYYQSSHSCAYHNSQL